MFNRILVPCGQAVVFVVGQMGQLSNGSVADEKEDNTCSVLFVELLMEGTNIECFGMK